jgi:hypothetical protein
VGWPLLLASQNPPPVDEIPELYRLLKATILPWVGEPATARPYTTKSLLQSGRELMSKLYFAGYPNCGNSAADEPRETFQST